MNILKVVCGIYGMFGRLVEMYLLTEIQYLQNELSKMNLLFVDE